MTRRNVLSDVIEIDIQSINKQIASFGEEKLALHSEEIKNELIGQYYYNPIVLDESGITIDKMECDINVSSRREYHVNPKNPYVKGLRITYYIPFTGDKELFDCEPNHYSFSRPSATIQGNEVLFSYDCLLNEVEKLQSGFQSDLNHLHSWVEKINQQVIEFNNNLPSLIDAAIIHRKQHFQQINTQIGNIGYKVRSKENAVSISQNPSILKPTMGTPENFEYDVAFSFAGENREYVEEAAKVVRAAGYKIFYDDFEKVNLWGKNLVDHLNEIYSKRSRYIVMFISRYYAEKAWPNHERRAAMAGALKSKQEVILPARFDNTEIPGLIDTVAYINLQEITPAEFANLIIEKIKI